ncbi:tryptophan 7-halogenase [Sandaracinobacter neustonicus]|uniref:Tryptophan 7-halogenase n=2 Tax=Sandaracinobacter neustonicus TaxID=1715348 RepID=A0A501XRH9_9SPHN|nr:tryptophan 7-halogenase [Sandaracinobacter neustonicus]
MEDTAIRSILVVGGGTSGWISAAVLARFLDPRKTRITVVESEEIGIVGVGEATVPIIRNLNGLLGIDENDFVAATNGSFKLGIEFRDWGETGNVHFHGFGDFGDDIGGVAPHHHWLKLRRLGDKRRIEDYSLPYALGQRGRFTPPNPESGRGDSDYRYAFHFDAALYAQYLRRMCEARGVVRVEGRITNVAQHAESGDIASVTLADGRVLEADFFIDCSGFRGLLIEQTLKTGYESWQHWLPCDRALAVPSSSEGEPPPFTTSTALEAGWQWRIPLQHRDGNGYVFSSRFTDEDRARELLLANIKGEALAEPRLLQFEGGRRRLAWAHNCVAIGLASGFLEPLESTSIQLIQTAIARLIDYFPERRTNPAIRDEYNRLCANEVERVRDFIILHYCLTRRTEPMWEFVRSMELPETLAAKIDLWKAMGRVPMMTEESYQEPSWAAIFLGNDVLPDRYDPLVDRIDPDMLARGMAARRADYAAWAERMPTQAAYIRRHCAMPA